MADSKSNTAEEVTKADVRAAVQYDPRDAEIDLLRRQLIRERQKHAATAIRLARTDEDYRKALDMIRQLRDGIAESRRATERTRRELSRVNDDHVDLLLSVGVVFDRLAERQGRIVRPCRN